MNAFIENLEFHHTGIAVKDFEKSLAYYKLLGYSCSDTIYDPLQDVELIMCVSDKYPDIELIKPASDKSPIVNYLKDKEEHIYHQCYVTNNLELTIKELKSHFKVFRVSKPKPAVLFNGKNVSFYYLPKIGLFEFIEE